MSTDPTSPPPAEPQAAETPAPDAGGAAPEIASTPEERQIAMYCHFGAFLPIFGFLVPLILWNTKKDSPFIEDQAKESTNFLINAGMIFLVSIIFPAIWIGLILVPLLAWGGTVAICVMAGMAANQGTVYRYPFNARYF